ncbi:hypothetical protein O181_002826 [Austropuccinia psidii MF-1]|uniref:Uncharacterized protein n=1 Tax=Austropuccinia psidii MF-1 TaxID=1389203 RepID=A0A9Q3BCM8_9BASI|nr:hypothetical protein [Austropuccinia psidii MF-1]
MENSFYSAIFNTEKDKPLTWFLKQKDRLSALHPDISDYMINMKILRKFEGELEHAIKCRCVEPFSTEEYLNGMEDIATRTITGKSWTRSPMESKIVSKTTGEDRRPEIPVLKCHKEEFGQDSEISEDKQAEDHPTENITAFLEVTGAHTHLQQ